VRAGAWSVRKLRLLTRPPSPHPTTKGTLPRRRNRPPKIFQYQHRTQRRDTYANNWFIAARGDGYQCVIFE